MATITFKAKAWTGRVSDGEMITVPVLERKHCDMSSFRSHPKYGAYANSDLFPSMLKRIRREMFGDAGLLRLSNLPNGVSVKPGFLHVVTIEV